MPGEKPDSEEPPRARDSDPTDFKSAADDPTAMWDEEALYAAGFDEVARRRKSLAPPPATEPDVKGHTPGSAVDQGKQRATSSGAAAARAAGGLSWPATVALALGLGAAVYVLVRLLR